jgi:hypothetical protein
MPCNAMLLSGTFITVSPSLSDTFQTYVEESVVPKEGPLYQILLEARLDNLPEISNQLQLIPSPDLRPHFHRRIHRLLSHG